MVEQCQWTSRTATASCFLGLVTIAQRLQVMLPLFSAVALQQKVAIMSSSVKQVKTNGGSFSTSEHGENTHRK